MPVSTTHPDYALLSGEWEKVDDAVLGPAAIEAKDEVYLPRPPGMNSSYVDDADDRYEFYKSFAEFPDIVAPAVRGITGLIHTNKSAYTLPPKLEYLRQRCTADGQTLEDFHKHVTRMVVKHGVYGLLSEIPEEGEKQPLIAGYSAHNIINWSESILPTGKKTFDRIVLDECGSRPRPNDPFETEPVDMYRVLRFEGGYFQEIYDDDAAVEPIKRIDISTSGKPFDEIPFTFVGSTDLTPAPNDIPVIGIVRAALRIYKLSAGYFRALYMSGDPQAVITGMSKDDDNAPKVVGGGSIWFIPKEGGRAEFIGPDANSIPYQEKAIQNKFGEAYEAGAQLLNTDSKSAESGEALQKRIASKTATILTIAITVASGLERALRNCARFLGADPSKVAVTPNLDFVNEQITAAEVLGFTQAKNQGFPISWEDLHEIARRGQLTSKTYEETRSLLEQEGPDLGNLGRDE